MEFFRYPYDSKKVQGHRGEIISQVKMDVGGHSAEACPKRFAEVRLTGLITEAVLPCVTKEYGDEYATEVMGCVRSYDMMREAGFPVPKTVRYYKTAVGTPALLMTDMTEGGRYRLWGYNDNPTASEYRTLGQMNLSPWEVKEIEAEVLAWAKRAGKQALKLYFYYYHVRQEIQSRKLDMVLLDVGSSVKSPDEKTALKENIEQVGCFSNEFKMTRKKASVSIR